MFKNFLRYRTELLIALAAIIIAACWLPTWMSDHPLRMRFPFDDTYITFRYSANLAHGYGIVWNVPTITQHIGAHTEGYTNFLFMLILVPFVWLGWDLVAVAQAVNVVAVAVSAIALYRIVVQTLVCKDVEEPKSSARTPSSKLQTKVCTTVAVALFLLDPFTWMNAYSGLETSLFTMWLLVALWAFVSERMELAFALSALAALTRPEGAMMGMVLLIVGMVQERKVGKKSDEEKASVLGYWLSAFVLPLVLYAAWKWWYFGGTIGALFPNSFYVKVSQVSSTFLPGRGTVRIFYTGMWYLLPLAALGVWKKWREPVVQIAAMWCIVLSGFYLFSLLIQNDYFRFFQSVEVFLILLTAIGVGTVAAGWTTSTGWTRWTAVAGLLGVSIGWSLYERGGLGYIERTAEENNPYRNVAEVFRSIPDSPSIEMAWGDAGRLPYYSGMRWIDPVGLNTNEIAHAHSAREVIAYIMAQKPDMIIIPLVLKRDESPGWNDSVRMIGHDVREVLPTGHGLIGAAYPQLAEAALHSTYKPIAIMPQQIYDLDILADTTSIHYRVICDTLKARIRKDPNFLPPVMRMR